MAKDPAFLFYPGDWLGGTMGMTFEQKGAYIELLMLQFNRGHMTSHMIGQAVGQLFGQIQDKFVQDEKGLWYNRRLDEEKENRKNFTESRRNNIKGVNQYTKNNSHKGGHTTMHMTGHMEDEDVNKDIIVINKESTIQEDSTVLSVFTLEAAERNQFTHTGETNTEFIKQQWETFILERKNDPSHKKRQNVGRIQEYFLNWIRTKFPKQKTNGKKIEGLDADEFIKQKLKK